MYDNNISLSKIGKNNITPLNLAIALNQESIVEFLLHSDIVTEEELHMEIDNWSSEKDSQKMGILFNLASLSKNKGILDILIR